MTAPLRYKRGETLRITMTLTDDDGAALFKRLPLSANRADGGGDRGSIALVTEQGFVRPLADRPISARAPQDVARRLRSGDPALQEERLSRVKLCLCRGHVRTSCSSIDASRSSSGGAV